MLAMLLFMVILASAGYGVYSMRNATCENVPDSVRDQCDSLGLYPSVGCFLLSALYLTISTFSGVV